MRNELDIVYQLLNIAYGGEVSNDDVIGERLMRKFLAKKRAERLDVFFKQGITVTDEVFQPLGEFEFNKNKYGDYESPIPPVILFSAMTGIKINKNGFSIPLLSRSKFELSKKNIINKSFPKATYGHGVLKIYPGYSRQCISSESSEVEKAVFAFNEEIAEFDDNEKITATVDAVLYYPGDGEIYGYNWLADNYPCPSEVISKILKSVTIEDLGLVLRQPSDQNVNSQSERNQGYEGLL